MDLKNTKVGFIGAGAMAEALLAGIIKANLVPVNNLYIFDVSKERMEYLHKRFGLTITSSNLDLVDKVDMIFLAVKPAVISKVLEEIGSKLKHKQTVISIAAGIKIADVEKLVPESIPVVRVMPNTPCLVGAGVSAIALGSSASEEIGQLVSELLKAAGEAVHVSEELMDSVTGLSGSGPAYMYLIMEALADGGVKVGLPRQLAITLAAQTMYGAAKMVLDSQEHPARLKDMVTTPGGTTIFGLHALEEGNIRATLINAVEKATNRSREMANK